MPTACSHCADVLPRFFRCCSSSFIKPPCDGRMESVGNLLRSVAISRKSVIVCSFSTQKLLRDKRWRGVEGRRTCKEESGGSNQRWQVNIPAVQRNGALDVSAGNGDQRVR